MSNPARMVKRRLGHRLLAGLAIALTSIWLLFLSQRFRVFSALFHYYLGPAEPDELLRNYELYASALNWWVVKRLAAVFVAACFSYLLFRLASRWLRQWRERRRVPWRFSLKKMAAGVFMFSFSCCVLFLLGLPWQRAYVNLN